MIAVFFFVNYQIIFWSLLLVFFPYKYCLDVLIIFIFRRLKLFFFILYEKYSQVSGCRQSGCYALLFVITDTTYEFDKRVYLLGV